MSVSVNVPLLADRYELHAQVTSGSACAVWRATDTALGRTVAVKLLHEMEGQRDGSRAAFRAQALAAGSLCHANIVRVYDYRGPAADSPAYQVTEFVDGPSLADVLAAGPMDPARALDVIAQVAAGVDALHRNGLAHGDLRPAHVLLSADGTAKLVGFPAAQSPKTETGPGHAAPADSIASDLRALGILACQCLAGDPQIGGAVGLPAAWELAEHPSLPLLPESCRADAEAMISMLSGVSPDGPQNRADDIARQAAELRDRVVAGIPAPGGVPPPGPVTRPLSAIGRGLQSRVIALTAGVAIATTLVFGLAGPGARHPAAASAGVTRVDVRRAELVGRPVGQVTRLLRHLGLTVKVSWRYGSRSPGRVISVRPAGWMPLGTKILVVAAARPMAGVRRQGSGTHRASHQSRLAGPVSSAGPAATPSATPSDTGSASATNSPSPTSTPSSSPSPSPSPSPDPSV